MHKHTLGELITNFYVTRVNSDLTEGRGREVDAGIFTLPTDAYQACLGKDVQGSNGDVYERTYFRCTECPQLVETNLRIFSGDKWGRVKPSGGKWVPDESFLPNGWRVGYDYGPK